ncbi:MAG TPA: PEP-CTERM sorting domain-containing protein [Rhodanobacteraceae bacterium]
MNKQKRVYGSAGFLAAGTLLAALIVAPCASANPVRIHFSGAVGNGYADLTVGPDTVADDPSGAMAITGASGTFSDATAGISNELITGVQQLNFAAQPANETLPGSYSHLAGTQQAPVGSYDNLFYVNGSPLVCIVNGQPTYKFSGGVLDIFGVMFTLGDGNLVDLWSAGVMPGLGLNYGFSIFDPSQGYKVLDAQGNGVALAVPAPGFLWLFGAGLLGLFAWRRRLEVRKRSVLDA